MKYKFTKTQKFYLFWKRVIDICGSSIGIVLLMPLILLVMLIIKITSKGPVFFRQKRIGKNKKIFRIVKFRSMRADAPEVAPSDMTPEQQKSMEYKWGNFMRKTSLDEIPQLFNIFFGDMSFIGPRPGAAHNEDELVRLRESYTPTAYEVRPGLGGLAQAKMNRDHDPELKAKFDSEYVKNVSFCLDAKLFLNTVFGIFGKGKGR